MENKLCKWNLSKKEDFKEFKYWYKTSSIEVICSMIKEFVTVDKNFQLNLSIVYVYLDSRINKWTEILKNTLSIIGALSVGTTIISVVFKTFSNLTLRIPILLEKYNEDRATDDFKIVNVLPPDGHLEISGHVSTATQISSIVFAFAVVIIFILAYNLLEYAFSENFKNRNTKKKACKIKKYIDFTVNN